MPYRRRKTTNKRRGRATRRHTYRRRATIGYRPPNRFAIHNFTRDIEGDLDLGRIIPGGAGPLSLSYTGDGGIAGSQAFALDDLPNHTEFAPLFKQYRIVAVKTFMYPTANSFTAGTGVNTQNNNVLIRMAPNWSGIPIAAGNTTGDWNQLQNKKRFIVRPDKPIIWYTKVRQLANVDAIAPSVPQVSIRPRFVDTTPPASGGGDACQHYGMNVRFDPVDQANPMALANESFPKFKVIQKVYFQMRGVK